MTTVKPVKYKPDIQQITNLFIMMKMVILAERIKIRLVTTTTDLLLLINVLWATTSHIQNPVYKATCVFIVCTKTVISQSPAHLIKQPTSRKTEEDNSTPGKFLFYKLGLNEIHIYIYIQTFQTVHIYINIYKRVVVDTCHYSTSLYLMNYDILAWFALSLWNLSVTEFCDIF